ncbi:hypothetical protein ACFL1H_05580, partial [Nanoarchaeota archaeon]
MITKEKTQFLDDLGGKEREIIIPQSTNLDFLINHWKNYRVDHKDIHKYLYEDTFEPSLNNIDFSNEDLNNFIYTLSTIDIGSNLEVVGTYTGYLLRYWYEKQRDNNKNTDFYINGHGLKFNNLFQETKYAGNVIVDNFKGQHIFLNFAKEGKAGNVVLMNCSGMANGQLIGNEYSKVRSVIALNNCGMQVAAACQNIDYYIAINNKADYTGGNCANDGDINLMILSENIGDNIAINLGKNQGEVHSVFMINNDLLSTGINIGHWVGKIKN